MLSRIARGVPRFSITSERFSLSTRFSSLPKVDLARRAEITILSFAAVLALGINSPVHLSELYSCKVHLSMARGGRVAAPQFRKTLLGGLSLRVCKGGAQTRKQKLEVEIGKGTRLTVGSWWRYGRGISSCLQMARTVPSLISRWRGTLAILCNGGLNQYHGQHPRDTKRNHGAADGVPIPRVSCFRYFENLTHGLWGKAFFRKLALALQRQL